MSVTQDYKTVTFSKIEFFVLLNALDARVKLADRFIEAVCDVTREKNYWVEQRAEAVVLRQRMRDLVWVEGTPV